MQGYSIMFPVIKVWDKDTNDVHIVGTNSHDTLCVRAGGIHYHNIQCCDGTGEDGCYEFETKEGDYFDCEIEMVSLEELCEIVKEVIGEKTEFERKLRDEMLPALQQLNKECSKNGGIFHS